MCTYWFAQEYDRPNILSNYCPPFYYERSHENRQTVLHVVFYFRAILDHKVCRAPLVDLEKTGPQESSLIQALQVYLENR